MNKKERALAVKSMETMIRCCNDEDIIDGWLMCGVADGDIKSDTTLDEIIEMGYCEDETFQQLLSIFLRIMYKAGIHGLYCDGIVSDTKHIDWR